MLQQCYAAVFLIVYFVLFRISNTNAAVCRDGGECVEVFTCVSAREAIRVTGSHTLERCGWNRLVEKVCCLDNEDLDTGMMMPSTSSSTEDDAGSVWSVEEGMLSSTTDGSITTKKNEPRGTVRKSEEACARYAGTVQVLIDWQILGGEDAEAGEFPHMVALGYLDTNDGRSILWNCAGSLISERHVLSAAHCMIRARPIRALLGVLNITETSATRKEFDVERIEVHPGYVRRTGSNDVAVVVLAGAVTFGGNVYPACLYFKENDPLGLIITGWGKILLGQDIRSDVLQKAKVVPVPLASCNETYMRRLNRALGPGQICAGPADPLMPTDSCPGDSGGPLQVFTLENMYAVVGVISFGITDCGGDSPSVYTRVYQYLDWIEGVVWN